MLEPDADARRREAARLRRVMRLAEVFGASVIGVFAGKDPEQSIEASMDDFAATWTPLVAEAADRGVVLAIENCPMFRGHRLWSINLAHTPWAYERIFERIDAPALGIELDPSHLVKQWLDVDAFVERFAARVVHVHAKDHERLPAALAAHGRFDLRASRDRFPGRGEVDFADLFARLQGHGYDGWITVEAEREPDAVDEASREALLGEAVAHLRAAWPDGG